MTCAGHDSHATDGMDLTIAIPDRASLTRRSNSLTGLASAKRFRHVVIERSCGGRVTSPFGKSGDLENTNATIQSDREHVIDLEGVSRRFLARAVDADMAGLDQCRSMGASFDHSRMPQPFIETLPLQGHLKSHQTGHQNNVQPRGTLIVRAPAHSLRPVSCSLSAASFANGEFGSIGRLTLARWRAAGVGAVRRSGIRTSLTAALAGALKPTLVLIPVSALALEALARRTSFALAKFTARWSLARGRHAFRWRIGGGLTDLFLTVAPSTPVPLAVLRLLARFSVRGRRLRAVLPRLLPAMTITIVTRTPLVGPATWPPDLNRCGLSVCRGNRRAGLGRRRVLGHPHGIDVCLRGIGGCRFGGIGGCGFGGIGRRRERNVGQ